MTLRAAAFRTVKSQLVAQQTIEPTMVAGFNQLFDDFNSTKTDQVAAGLDIRATSNLTVGLDGIYRRLSPQLTDSDIDRNDVDVLLGDAEEAIAQAYLYWTATDRMSVSLEMRGSRFREHNSDPQGVNTILVPLSVRYFGPRGFFAIAGMEYVSQSVIRQDSSGGDTEKWGDAWLVDTALGYRLPGRHGIVSLELNNLFNHRLHWQDDTFRSSEQQNRRFLPERSAMVRVSLNF